MKDPIKICISVSCELIIKFIFTQSRYSFYFSSLLLLETAGRYDKFNDMPGTNYIILEMSK